jgi:D-glycero-D-manno-heptose 1,7-bisphosphate phosphatase
MRGQAKRPSGAARDQERAIPAFQYTYTPALRRFPAVFIDRDGTLNEMVYDETHGLLDSPRRPEQVRLKKGAADFLRGLKRAGFLTVIVTNQPGIAKGTLTVEELDAVNRKVARLLSAGGAEWDDLYFCPHHPTGVKRAFSRKCPCRKPKPGMLMEAAKKQGINLSESWMVGDGLNDVQAGRAAGCKTILVTKLKLDQVEHFFTLPNSKPTAIASNLREALKVVRAASKSRKSKGGGS